VAALQDRGHVLMFEPSAEEVHRKVGAWFDDAEIYEWFAKNLSMDPNLYEVSEPEPLRA
jgi:hypothetical protein